MVKIRFRRVGLKRQPTYRIVVCDERRSRNGRFIEVIGHHNPRTRPSTDVVQEDRVLYWMSVGAQPSEAVANLLKRTGTLARYERLMKGEAMDSLVAEAAANQAAAVPISPKTRYDSPAAGEGTFKPKENR